MAIPAAFLPVLLKVESVGTFPLSDRFLYLAALGFSLLVAHAAITRLSKKGSTIALTCLALAYTAQDISHAAAWSDDEALFRTALEQNPRNPNIHWSLGRVLLEEFQESSELEPLNEATSVYEAGMELLAEARNSDFSIFASEDDAVQMNLGLGWCQTVSSWVLYLLVTTTVIFGFFSYLVCMPQGLVYLLIHANIIIISYYTFLSFREKTINVF